ncbi:10051_t:CDS:2, partial [Ambispora gerdemannii]
MTYTDSGAVSRHFNHQEFHKDESYQNLGHQEDFHGSGIKTLLVIESYQNLNHQQEYHQQYQRNGLFEFRYGSSK